MFFSVFIPGIGEVFVEAGNRAQAVAAVQQFLNRNRIRLEEGSSIGGADPVTRDEVTGDLLLDSAGVPTALSRPADSTVETAAQVQSPGSTGLPGASNPGHLIDFTRTHGDDLPDSTGPDAASMALSLASTLSVPLFVGKVVNNDGSVRFARVNSTDTSQARSILQSRFGSAARIETVSTPEFLLENDSDFLAFLQGSGQPDLSSFVLSLELVSAREDGAGDEVEPTYGTDPELPVDVQSFPFASFQNAVAQLGLDPEGVLGSTISQRFNALAPAAQIGSLTGTVDPIGQDPGALQEFFSQRFGDLDLAARTFRDLLAGTTGGDLSADQLLAFQALQEPDIATSRGRGAAADVFRLARAAAEDRFGSFVASRLLPSNARLFRELERALAEGDPSTDFLQFARQQNLLPV